MKVKTFIEYSDEVEVDIDREDLVAAFRESPDPGETWLTVLNRFGFALRAIPDATIAALTEGQRRTIATFLTEQAHRFEEPA